MTGLLINGTLHPVDGLAIVPPASHGGPSWAALDVRDYRVRKTSWVRGIVVHTTKGIWPQFEIPGAGVGGKDRVVADFWRRDPEHSAAQIVVDTDGSVACLCDLARVAAHHATTANPWTIGIEMYQMPGGGIYEATLDATAQIIEVLCEHFGIAEQFPRGPYRQAPLRRLMDGGEDTVGVYGHRDQTSRRGRGDPGDMIWQRLAALGFVGVDYDGGEDLELGRARQRRLNELDARAGITWSPLVVDGVLGPASVLAMRRHGFRRWRDLDAQSG